MTRGGGVCSILVSTLSLSLAVGANSRTWLPPTDVNSPEDAGDNNEIIAAPSLLPPMLAISRVHDSLGAKADACREICGADAAGCPGHPCSEVFGAADSASASMTAVDGVSTNGYEGCDGAFVR